MPTVKIITVKKPGVQRLGYTDSGTFYDNVPVGTKAAYVRLTPLNPDADIEVIAGVYNGWNAIEFWKFPTEFPDFFIDTVDVEQNPDGSFNPVDKAKLPDWLYTDGLINKIGFGLIKKKHLPWIIAAVLGYLILTDEKK